MAARSSLAARAALALTLMALFFALAIGAIIACAWLGVGVLQRLPSIHGRGILVVGLFGIACLVVAGVVAWSILPRPDRFEPPGPELTRADAPALFAEIDRLSAQTKQAPPAHVYLVGNVNAFVTQRGGFMGFGARRVMGIGLPLVTLLGVDELRAVLAHEYGHFHGGDVAIGPWIYKTRGAMIRTVVNLGRAGAALESTRDRHLGLLALVLAAVRTPFRWFGLAFLRTTQAISRAQERTADALAAEVVGPGALVEGLQKAEVGARAFDAYVGTEVAPALDRGFRPPVAAGFRAFLDADEVRGAIEARLAEARTDERADPYDSHPSLRERIAAFPDAPPPADRRPATELLGDVAAHEIRLFDFLIKDRELRAIAWRDVALRVHVPQMRDEVARVRRTLAGLTPATLPRDPALLLARFRDEVDGEVTARACAAVAARTFGAALMIALVDAGGEPISEIAGPVVVRVQAEQVEPFREVRRYLVGETEPDAWHAWVTRLGIADVRLDRLARVAPAAPTA